MGIPPETATAAKPPRSWKRRLLGYGLRAAVWYLVFVVVMLALENFLLYRGTGAGDWYPPPAAPRPRPRPDVHLRAGRRAAALLLAAGPAGDAQPLRQPGEDRQGPRAGLPRARHLRHAHPLRTQPAPVRRGQRAEAVRAP